MICPNCGANSPTDDCINCGVIISKHISLETKTKDEKAQHSGKKKFEIYIEEKPGPAKAIILNVVFLSVCLIVYIIACPFIASNKLKKAVEQKNTAEMSQLIDYESLKASLKKQFDDRVIEGKSKSGDPTASLAASYVSKLTEPMVDEAVTPDGIYKMMTGYKKLKSKSATPEVRELGPDESKSISGILIEARQSYDSFGEFSIVIDTEKGSETRIVMKRAGVFAWKVDRIILGAE